MLDQTQGAGSQTDATDPTTPVGDQQQVSGVAGQKNQPQQGQPLAEEWQRRAAGWQSKFQAEQQERNTIQQQLEALQQQMAGIQQDRDKVNTDFQSLLQSADQTKTDLEVTQAQYQRLEIVATEFPDLLPLYREGALPDLSGDELRAKLKVIQSAISSRSRQDTQDQLAGATPPSPAKANSRTSQDAKVEAMIALQKGDQAAYNRLMDEYYKLSDQEKK